MSPDFEVKSPGFDNDGPPVADRINIMPFELDYTGPTDSVQKFLPSEHEYDILFRGNHIEAHKIPVPENLKMLVCDRECESVFRVKAEAKELTVWGSYEDDSFANVLKTALNTVGFMRACAAEDE